MRPRGLAALPGTVVYVLVARLFTPPTRSTRPSAIFGLSSPTIAIYNAEVPVAMFESPPHGGDEPPLHVNRLDGRTLTTGVIPITPPTTELKPHRYLRCRLHHRPRCLAVLLNLRFTSHRKSGLCPKTTPPQASMLPVVFSPLHRPLRQCRDAVGIADRSIAGRPPPLMVAPILRRR